MLGRTGRRVGEVGLGAWQLGADWGAVDDPLGVISAAIEAGVTLIDTADVYGDGRSEQLIGQFLREHPGVEVTVATKMGRRVAQVPESYVLENFRQWTDRSRRNLGVQTLDLVQLHCPPTSVYDDDAVFDALDTLVAEGRVAAYGVSVETRAEALRAIQRPGVASVQIILNMLRLGPLDDVLPAAGGAGVGILARCRWRAGCSPDVTTPPPRSPRTTTAPTTGTARRSTSVRHSRASTTRPDCGPWSGCVRCARRAYP